MDSYVSGATEPPLLNITIGHALEQASHKWPNDEAVICPAQSVRLTWRQLWERVENIAAGMLAMDLHPRDRVGIWSLNRVEWVITQFAAARAGLVLVTISPAYRINELEYALNKVGYKTLFVSPAFKSSNYLAMVLSLAPELAHAEPVQLLSARLPHLRLVVQMEHSNITGARSFEEVERCGKLAGSILLTSLEAKISSDDAINIQFTSGTTGTPKGDTLTHKIF